MARKSGFVRRGGVMRRETLWAPIDPAFVTLTGGGTVLQYTASAAEDALRPYTIIRTHMMVTIISDQLIASELQWIGIGGAVVSDQASAIGVTACPTPVTDLGSDAWYFHTFLANEFTFITAAGFQDGGLSQTIIDSKAMRKVEDGFDNVVTIEAVATTDGTRIRTAGRQLLKLH